MAPAVGVLSDNPKEVREPLIISSSTDINGSVSTDTIVKNNCSLRVHGNLIGSLTIEPGANVLVDGSVDGKIINRGGRLVVNHDGLAAYVSVDGPAENEAGATLKINLAAIASNWKRLAKAIGAECAAVVGCDAYGCGIDPIVKVLAKSGCGTFFVTDLSEARRVRAAAPHSTIYVLNGFYFETGPVFAEINARPVINSSTELAAWDVFVGSTRWRGGCGLNVDTGENALGLSVEEAIALVPRLHVSDHGIALLTSNLATAENRNDPVDERQIALFRDLRRLYGGVTASLANPNGILNPKCHFDLVRAGAALLGVNPIPGSANPMLSVVELRARIVQVRDGTNGRRRVAFASIGRADGFPSSWPAKNRLYALIGGYRCPISGPPFLDLLPIDVTDLPDAKAARMGERVTLIDSTITIDEVAEAAGSTGEGILSGLGRRFHRVYYAT